MKLPKTPALVAGIFALMLLASIGHCATLVWTNTAGGVWGTSSNWFPNLVPGSSDDAIITNAGTFTVTLNTSLTVGSLTLGGSSGQQRLATAAYTLTLNSNSVVNGSGVLALDGGALNGSGALTVIGLLNWTGGQISPGYVVTVATNGTLVLAGVNGSGYVSFGVITNAGTVQLVSGNLQLENYYGGITGGLFNQASGVVELTADVSITAAYNTPVFVNQGTLVKSGGINTSTIYPYFINSGTVEANTGTISINGLGASFGAGCTFLGTGQTVLSANTVTLNGSLTSSNLVLAGANLSGSTALNGVLTWTSGQINSDCALTVTPGAVLTLAGVNGSAYVSFGVITNTGTVQLVSGNLQLENYYGGITGWLFNQPSGVVNLAADVSITAAYNTPELVNQGTVLKSGGTHTSAIQPYLNNSGTVEANTGTINLNNLGTTLNAGSAFLGAGQTLLSTSTVTLNGSLTSSNLVLAGANLSGSAALSGVLTWTSGQINRDCTLTVTPGAVLALAGVNGSAYVSFGVITNAGTVQLVSGNLQLENYYGGITGWLFNQPSGVVDLAADVSITAAYNTPELVNQGTVLKSGGTHTSAIQSYLNNSGTVEANTGTIDFNDLGATLNTGSSFLGAGQILLSGGTVTFNGSLSSSNLVMAGAVFGGNGMLDGVLTWTSGQINRGGALTVNSDGVLIFAGTSGSTYVNFGVITNLGMVQLTSGSLQLNNYYGGISGWLFNQPAGVVEFTSDVSIAAAYNTPEIVNQGTLVKVGGTNTSTIQPALSNVGGALGAISGTLSLGGNNFVQNGGTVFVNLGGTNTGQSGALTGVGSATLGGLLTVTLTNGFVPALGSQYHILSSSSRSGALSPLNIPSGLGVSYSNSGVYLTVTNTVNLAPAITVQPTNVTVPYAGSVLLSVAATGMTPLSYQWFWNGAALSDGGAVSGSASPSLVLNGITDDNAGKYCVTVSNSYGSVTSVVAKVSVLNCTAPPTGLVSWWPGNGNALDIVSGNNGVLSNGVTYTPAEVGQGFAFMNNHAGVVVGNPTNLQLQSFTIEAWIQRASTNMASSDPTAVNGSGLLFSYGLDGYGLGIFTNGALFLSQIDVTNVSSAAAVTDTNLHHVAVTAASKRHRFLLPGWRSVCGQRDFQPWLQFQHIGRHRRARGQSQWN
jgi:hypothetical protein